MKKLVTGDHPWHAQSFSSNPARATLAKLDAWTGIPSLLANTDYSSSGNWFDEAVSSSKQYVSKSESEAGFMAQMAMVAVGGAEGIAGLERIGTTARVKFGPVIENDTVNVIKQLVSEQRLYDDTNITVAHFPKTQEARRSIVQNGLWNTQGRDTLIPLSTDLDKVARFSYFDDSFVDPVIMRVPIHFVGSPDESLGGRLGLAIYRDPSLSEFTSRGGDIGAYQDLFQRTANMPVKFDIHGRGPLVRANDVGALPGHIPSRYILNAR